MTQEITIEDVHTGLREELNTFTDMVLSMATDVGQFTRAGRISKITAEDAIEIEMDDALAQIEANPTDSAGAIEQLAYLYLARIVASRIASGAVMSSRDEANKAVTKRRRRTKAQIAADEATAEPEVKTPAPVEPEVEPETPEAPAEVLESDQAFLAEKETDTTEPVEPVALAKANNDILNML